MKLLTNLRARTSLLVLLVFSPIFAVSILFAEEQRRHELDQAQASVLRIAQNISADNRRYIDSTFQLLSTLTRLDSIHQKDWVTCQRLLADIFKDLSLYSNVFVVDTATGLNSCSAMPLRQPVTALEQEWYQIALRTQSRSVGNYQIGLVTGQPVVIVSVPVFDEREQVIAVVAAGLRLNWLNLSLVLSDLPPEGRITLIDRDGIVLARYPEQEGIIGLPYSRTELLDHLQLGQEGTVLLPDRSGVDRLYGYTTFGEGSGDMTVLVSLPEAYVLTDVQNLQIRNLMALGGITLLVMFMAWVSSGLIVRPIHNLTATSRAIAAGQLESRSPLRTEIIELQELLDAFNDMAASVEQTMRDRVAQLMVVNRSLEREIRDRIQAQEHTRILLDLTSGFAKAFTTDEVLHVVIEKGLAALGAQRAAVAISQGDGQPLTLVSYHGLSAEKALQFEEMSPDANLPLVEAFRTGESVWLESNEELAARYPELHAAFSGEAERALSMVCLPLIVEKRIIGSMGVSFPFQVTKDGPFKTVVSAINNYCVQVLERVQLAEQAREASVLAERQRLARDLHDAVSQTLFSSTLIAETLTLQWRKNPEKALQNVDQLLILNRGAMAEMRNLLYTLRPDALEKAELKELLGQLIDAARGRTRITASLVVTGESPAVPSEVMAAFYRIAQESINNIVKHSHATSFRVELTQEDSQLTLFVSDDGQGFDTNMVSSGFGLGSMRERAEAIQAALEITSAPGNGTSVCLIWKLPVADL